MIEKLLMSLVKNIFYHSISFYAELYVDEDKLF